MRHDLRADGPAGYTCVRCGFYFYEKSESDAQECPSSQMTVWDCIEDDLT